MILFFAGVWEASKIEFDFSPRAIFMTQDPELDFLDDFETKFTPSDNIIYILFKDNKSIFNYTALKAISNITNDIEKITGVDKVLSITNSSIFEGSEDGFNIINPLETIPQDKKELKKIEQEITSEPLLEGQIISKNAKATSIIIQLLPDYDTDKTTRPIINKINEIVSQNKNGDETFLGGLLVISKAYADILKHDLIVFTALSLLISFIVLFIIFRNIKGIYIPISVVMISTTLSVALMAITGQKLNVLNNIIPPFLLVYGLADSIHQINRYYEEVGKGHHKMASLKNMLAAMTLACLMTSVTTAAGFGANYTAQISIVKKFGLLAAGAVLIAYIVTIIFVPVALSFHKEPKSGIKKDLDSGFMGKVLVWISKVNDKHRRLVLLLTLLFTILAIWGTSKVKVEYRMLQELKSTHPVSIANQEMEDNMSGVIPLEIAVYSDEEGEMKNPELLKEMDKLTTFIKKQPGVTNVLNFMDLIKRMNKAFHNEDPKYYTIPDNRNLIAQYLLLYSMSGGEDITGRILTEDYSKMRISIALKDVGSEAFFKLLKRIKDYQKTLNIPKGITIHYTGSSVIVNKALKHVIWDLLDSFAVAFILVFLLVFIEFSSIRLAALSMVPTVLPMIFTTAIMGF